MPRESLVRDIPAGDGNIEKLFYGVVAFLLSLYFFSIFSLLVAGDDAREKAGVDGEEVGLKQPRVVRRDLLTLLHNRGL